MSGLGATNGAVVDAARPSHRWRLVLLWSLAALVLLLVVLAVSGVSLSTSYRPVAPGAAGLPGAPDQTARDVHRLAATLAQSVVLVSLVSALGWSYQLGRRRWIGPALLLLLVLAASYLGGLLPYDQLALWAVTVGDQVEGVWVAAFDKGVRFVLVDGVEVSQATYQRWVLAHLAAAGAAGVGLAVVARSVLQSRRSTDG